MSHILQLWLGRWHVGKKGGARQSETASGVFCYEILLTGVVEDRGFQEELPQMKCEYAEEVRNHRVDGGSLPGDPGDGGCVV